MDLELEGKTVFISGSSAGIGLAIGVLLAKEGANVTLNAETQELLDKGLSDAPCKIGGIVADLSISEGIQKVIEQLPQVDILINNLGIFEPKSFTELTDEDWYRIFAINVMSGIGLTRHYLSHMLKKNWGRIIFVSSESGVMIPEEMIHYGVTKTAQIAIARGTAQITAGSNVTINSILPGPTRTPSIEEFFEDLAHEWHIKPDEVEEYYFEKVRPTSLLNRFENSEEVASLAAFLCSPLASAINGAAVRVEGGVINSIL